MFGAADNQLLAATRSPLFGYFDLLFAGKILPRKTVRLGHDLFQGAMGNDLSATHAGSGSEVHHMVGRPHCVFIVFHDQHGIALVSQATQRV